MFFCLPIFFGCQTKIKPESSGQPSRSCPRCHNASVIAAKKTTWFEFFFVPVIPFSSKHIWICGICQWKSPQGAGQFEPAIAGAHPPGGYQQPNAPGYQPVYLAQQPPK
jgi:ribosomal protein L37AE/L43A